MNADKLVRLTGYVAVFAVAAVAALLSYWHAVTVVGAHGEPGVYGHLYPATIDGLIVAASMVLLDAARKSKKAPRLAWWLVGGGIAATLAANVLDGVSGGFLGSIIAAWPAAAFIGAYEMIMMLVRSRADEEHEPAVRVSPGGRVHPVEPVAGPSVETLERIQANLPAVASPPPPSPPAAPVEAPASLAQWVDQAGPQPTFVPNTEQAAGTVTVRNPPGSRLDQKVPADQRPSGWVTGSFPAIRETGTFPVVTE